MKSYISRSVNMLKNALPLELAFLINAVTVVHIKLVPYGISILFLIWLFELLRRKITLDKSKLKASLFVSIPFFLALYGLLFTTNYAKGIEEVSRVLPFLLFPFFFLFHYKKEKQRISANWYFIVFTCVLLIRLLINLYESIVNYLETSKLYYFIYIRYVQDTNIVSIYVLFAILGLFVLFKKKKFKDSPYLFWSIQLFLLISLMLLQSRIVIASYFIAMTFILLIAKRDAFTKYGIFLLVFPLALFLMPINQSRFKTIKKDTTEVILEDNKNESTLAMNDQAIEDILTPPAYCNTSFKLRMNALKSSWNGIVENPIFGVGTGDWRDVMTEDYKKNNKVCNYIEQTAPHNQYLRTALKHGLVGIIVLLFYIVVLAKTALRSSTSLALPLVITIVLTGFGYDVLDVGGLAPINAFFLTVIFVPILFKQLQ